MKRILLVDDELPFLKSLRDGLLAMRDDLALHLAGDGQEALLHLKQRKFDLLVTDLKLPVMDGFQLLAHTSRLHPDLPVIVMTAFGTPEIEERLSRHSGLHYLEKPLDIDHLANTIDLALKTEGRSYIQGISLATFLQLVVMEKKTCTLKITSGQHSGYLFVRGGELIDATTGEKDGEAAALDIVTWADAVIEMDPVCRRQDKVVEASLEFLLMEAFRLQDEANMPKVEDPDTATEKNAAAAGPQTCELDLLEQVVTGMKDVLEYAIFDRQNFLERHSPLPCSLDHLDPTFYLEAAGDMTGLVGNGTLNFIVVRGKACKHLMLECLGYRLVLRLDTKAKASRTFAALRANLEQARKNLP
ncbi:MAG: response regulator [Deltaproteobacteria bacterium]|nr:MAG: response regulator [Deltaproteobacteria bacterium]